MTAVAKPHFLTEQEYLRAEEIAETKHEYLGGQVHAMAGANNRHNRIATNFLGNLHAQLRGKRCQPCNSDTKVRIEFRDHIRFYYPDAMVVCEPSADHLHYQEKPVIVLEVLSPSTRRTDLGEKNEAYLSIPTLRCLLLADSETQSLIVHLRQPDGRFETQLLQDPASQIPLPDIEANLSLSDLYEGIDLPAITPPAAPPRG